jgi:hypothetical protein
MVCPPLGGLITVVFAPAGLPGWERFADAVARLAKKTERWADHPHRPAVPDGLSPFSLHGYARAWKTFFHWCLKRGYLTEDPTNDLRWPPLPEQPPKAVLPGDLTHWLAAARGDARDYALICFLADTCDPFSRNRLTPEDERQGSRNLDNLMLDVGRNSHPPVSGEQHHPYGSD